MAAVTFNYRSSATISKGKKAKGTLPDYGGPSPSTMGHPPPSARVKKLKGRCLAMAAITLNSIDHQPSSACEKKLTEHCLTSATITLNSRSSVISHGPRAHGTLPDNGGQSPSPLGHQPSSAREKELKQHCLIGATITLTSRSSVIISKGERAHRTLTDNGGPSPPPLGHQPSVRDQELTEHCLIRAAISLNSTSSAAMPFSLPI